MFRFALPAAVLTASLLVCDAQAGEAASSAAGAIAGRRTTDRNTDKDLTSGQSGRSGILFSESFDDANDGAGLLGNFRRRGAS